MIISIQIKFNIIETINELNLTNYIENYKFRYLTIKIFNSPTKILIILIVNYLLFCFLVIVKISNNFMGPLRKINYE